MSMVRSNFVYGTSPQVYKRRSQHDLSHSHKTMFNQGELVPILVQEVYPGDTFKTDLSSVVRTTTPFIRPIMDNLFIDFYFFFVPNRLTYERWQEVMGENKKGPWAPSSYAVVPAVTGTVSTGSVADYMGVQSASAITGSGGVSRLPFRAFGLIYDQWFRDENLQQPMDINITDIDNTSFNNNAWAPNNIYGMLPHVNKFHDYFTSCLPSPQKGAAVDVPINGFSKVVTTGLSSQMVTGTDLSGSSLLWCKNDGSSVPSSDLVIEVQDGETNGVAGGAGAPGTKIVPRNLIINGETLGAGVNDIRYAFALQRMLEKDARGGTRYVEYLLEHFGTVSPDSRLQRTEFLGGKRIPLQLQQVQQTSQSTENSPLAQVGAYSLTNGRAGFTKSFTEHGFIVCVACVRQFHTYQQGLEKFWTRLSRYDFYDPSFALIGEQPVYTSEIYNDISVRGQIFGYNEAYADLRYKPSRISGQLRSINNNGFDVWHLGDEYANAPVLGDQFIQEPNIVDRVLSVPSTTAPNFIADFYFKTKAIRVIPAVAEPSLIDHM